MHHMMFRYQLQQQDESHCQRIHEQSHVISTNRHRIHQAAELRICYQLSAVFKLFAISKTNFFAFLNDPTI